MSDREDTPPDDRILQSARRPIAHVSLGPEGDRIVFRQLRERQQQQRRARAAEVSRAFTSEAAATAAMATSAMVTSAQQTSQANSSGIVGSTVAQTVSQSTGVMASQAVVLTPEDVAIQQAALQEAQLQQALGQIKAEKEKMIRRRARMQRRGADIEELETMDLTDMDDDVKVVRRALLGVIEMQEHQTTILQDIQQSLAILAGRAQAAPSPSGPGAWPVAYPPFSVPQVTGVSPYVAPSSVASVSLGMPLSGGVSARTSLQVPVQIVFTQTPSQVAVTTQPAVSQPVQPQGTQPQQLVQQPVSPGPQPKVVQGPGQTQWVPKTAIAAPKPFTGDKRGEDLDTSLRYGLYGFVVMPFGFCNAPGTFQHAMNQIFYDYLDKFVIVYLDDILIFSKTVEEHVANLGKVLGLLRQHKFKINGEKCEFGRTRVLYLGHEISAEGLKPNDAKVANIRDWPRPQSVTEMRSFLGMIGYYRNFVENYSIVAAPLTDLTRLDTPWEWTERCEAAFKHLKHALTHYEVLKLPDPDKPFIVCQRDKPRTQAPLELLKPLPIPQRPGESLSIDFMDTLVTSKSGMRYIYVIVDRFSKFARLVAMPETVKTEHVIKMFKENWVRDFGLPKSIVSDRDVRFTSELWKAAAAEQGTQLQMTSGNHPGARGQAEQMNRAVQEEQQREAAAEAARLNAIARAEEQRRRQQADTAANHNQARRDDASVLMQQEAAHTAALQAWHVDPAETTKPTTEDQTKSALASMMHQVILTCNWQQVELARQARTITEYEDTLKSLHACLDMLQKDDVPHRHTASSSIDPSIRELEGRLDHLVAIVDDLNNFRHPTTISQQIAALQADLRQLQQQPTGTCNNLTPKQYKMRKFSIDKFDDYHKADPISWWQGFTNELSIHSVPSESKISALYLCSTDASQVWLNHLAQTEGVEVSKLYTKITWEAMTEKWRKRFIVDDAQGKGVNRIFSMHQGSQPTREWLTEWQKIVTIPNLDIPFVHLRREFFQRSVDVLSTTLGERSLYTDFDQIVEKANEVIQTNRWAANERRNQPNFVEKGKGPRP
ncbi:hypothetical protein CBR_g28720 [Chara braunii]|uniref:Integrase catalytic domain-containing protein n=1 Tax=Chara braunii TaxID=69332 RepID=A0A388L9L4_CHABU|nr:hypothetical protein CBR_g28720 [Chara braunii]|eukprot:GBG79007.1 hypothetical protein CBR_g28720 [Chara braunii]